jgi:hypothetical protein
MIVVAIGLTFLSLSWIVWTALTVVMMIILGPHHPPTLDDDEPISNSRRLLAIVALIILALCFTPAPIGDFLPSS